MKIHLILSICFLLFIGCSNGITENNTAYLYSLTINPDFLASGCYEKDCIPAIYNPVFQTGNSAAWLNNDDLVIAFKNKAYPLKILNWHQIVNDKINNTPIIVTYCPLSGTAAVYESRINGVGTTFGNSGSLYNNNFILYDHLNEDLWLQFNGENINKNSNLKLKKIPSTVTTWKKWLQNNPQTEVLSLNTGFTRDYNKEPYPDYENSNLIYFNLEKNDKTLPPKTVVYGIIVNNQYKAFPEKSIINEMMDKIGDIPIKIEKKPSGEITFTNMNNHKNIPYTRTYWFTWANFSQNSEVAIF